MLAIAIMRRACDLRRFTALAAVAVTLLAARAAHADACDPPAGISPCVDAQGLWLPAAQARFVAIPSARGLPQSGYAAGVGVLYMSRPIVLRAPSPDPDGRDVDVVDRVFDAALLYAHGITDELEVTAALPFGAHQSGAGVAGATSQTAAPISPTVIRDPRAGIGFSLFWHGRPRRGYGAKTRLELVIPLGDRDAFAGDSSFGLAPSAVLELRHGRFFAGSEVGARLRSVVTLADIRWGSQALVSLGIGFDIFEADRLSVAVEGWLAPLLVSQEARLPSGARVEDAVIVPAEWLASVRSQLVADVPFTLQLGGGTGLPLSSARRVAADGTQETENFASVTTPAWRAVLVARYMSP